MKPCQRPDGVCWSHPIVTRLVTLADLASSAPEPAHDVGGAALALGARGGVLERQGARLAELVERRVVGLAEGQQLELAVEAAHGRFPRVHDPNASPITTPRAKAVG